MPTKANVLAKDATLYYKIPWTSPTWVEPGYTKDGADFVVEEDLQDIMVRWSAVAVDRYLIYQEIMVRTVLAEATLDNIEAAIAGATRDGNAITLGIRRVPKIGVKLVGKNPAGFDRTIEIPYGSIKGGKTFEFRRPNLNAAPFQFAALRNGNQPVAIITDSTS